MTGGLISEHPTCETVFQRQHTDRWIWDGKFFQFDDRTYSQPIYRFQSALDGDVAFALREYDRSLAAYQKAIFSTEIHPRNWLPPQLEHCRRIGSGFDGAGVDPTQESLQLGAYARWRIVLIHAIQNHKDAMEVVYKTLQEKFPPGVTGHDYAAIGAAFWETYTKSNDISAACEKAKEAAQGLALYPGHEPATICFLP